MRMLQGDSLSHEELKRLIYVWDTILDTSDTLSKTDMTLCREQLEQKIAACDMQEPVVSEEIVPDTSRASAGASVKCESEEYENSQKAIEMPLEDHAEAHAKMQTKVVGNDVRGVGFTSRESEIQISNQSDGFYVAVDAPTRIDDASGNSSITLAAASSDITDPESGVNMYTGSGHCRIFTGTTSSSSANNNFERLEVTPEGGINMSAGDIEAQGDVGLNVLVSGSGTAQAETLSSDAASVNIAVGVDAVATSQGDNTNGFNFAAQSATATSDDSNGFNFAALRGTAIASNGSDGFNFAAQGATSRLNTFSNGLNFASMDTTVENSNSGNGSMLFALGKDGAGSTPSSISNTANNDSFTVVVGGSQVVDPQEGVNAYTGFGHYRVFTGSSNGERIEVNPEGGVNISAGDMAANGDVGLNVLVSGSGTAQAETLSGDAASVNIAVGENAIATSAYNSNGCNVATRLGQAKSVNSDGFNFAAQNATATSSALSHGFNFASKNTRISSSAEHGSILFTLGDAGFGGPSSIELNEEQNSFTVAVGGATPVNPKEGVNFYINHFEPVIYKNSPSNLRFFGLPSAEQDGSENFLVIDTATNAVRTSAGTTDISSKFGFIAEEVADLLPESVVRELVVRDSEGRPYGLNYKMFAPILLKYIQMQHDEIEKQNTEIVSLQEKNAEQDEKNMMQDALIHDALLRLAAIEAR
jgi:hypothetical protein